MERVIVAGGGYAGLAALDVLTDMEDVQLRLVDPSPGHQLIPELPSALRPEGSVEEHVVPFRELLARQSVEHVKDRVRAVHARKRAVTLESGRELPFDWLVMSPGSATRWPPIPGLQDHAYPFRTAADAARLRERVLRGRNERVVVLGGGLTGVELAGELTHRHHVEVVEMAPRILTELGPGLARYGLKTLRGLGITISTSVKATAVKAGSLEAEGGRAIPFDVLIWTGGIKAPDIRWDGVDLDDRGYPVADRWGEAAPRVFAAGDVWVVKRPGRDPVPQTAQIAMEAGAFVGGTIRSRIRQTEAGPPFHPHFDGLLVALDPWRGVGWVVSKGLPVKGLGARALKSLVFKRYRYKLAQSFPD